MKYEDLKKQIYITKVDCYKDFYEVRDKATERIISSGSKQDTLNYLDCVLNNK